MARAVKAGAIEQRGRTDAGTRKRVFRALHRLALQSAGLLSPTELANVVSAHARRLIRADTGVIWLWEAQAGTLIMGGVSDTLSLPPPVPVPPGSGVVGRTFSTRRPVIVDRYDKFKFGHAHGRSMGASSALAVPLELNGEAFGVLMCVASRPAAFSRKHARILALLAAQSAPGLQAARLHEEAEEKRREAEALAALMRDGARSRDASDVLSRVATVARDLAAADASAVLMLNAAGALELAGACGPQREPLGATWPRPLQGPLAAALNEHQAVVCELDQVEEASGMSGCLEGLHSAIAAPLLIDEEPIGCLVLGWQTDQTISPRQVRWAETMAGYGAILIDSAHSHAMQLERTAELTAVIEQMPSGVLVVGPDRQVRLRNTVARRIRGEQETTDRLIGRDTGYRMVDVDQGELLPDSVLPLSRALLGERVDRFEYILQRPDPLGDIRVFASAAPIYAGNQLIGAVMVYSDVTHERQMAADLAAREAHLQTVYDSMACGIIVHQADGSISHMNQAAETILGVRFDGSSDPLAAWRRLREDGSEMAREEWPTTQAFATGEVQRFPLCGVRAPDSTVRWLHLEAVPLKDADGNVLEVVISIVDQSDQKRVEDQLRDQAIFQQAVMNSLGEGLYATDEDGRVTYLNQAAEEMLGWTRDELVGLFAHSAFHYRRPNDDELSDDRCLMLQALRTSGAVRREDDLLLRRDGTLLPVRWTASAVIAQGESTGLVVAFQDITERQRTQEALRASEERYRTIVETSNEGICLVDADSRILYVNRRMQDLNGYTASEQIGHLLDEFNTPEAAEAIQRGAEDARQRGEPLQVEFEMPHKAGGKQWVLMTANALLNEQGEPVGRVSMFTDLSAIKASEQALAYQALHDSLTGLPNRALLRDRLEQAILNARRSSSPLAVVFIDLDGFKEVNDTFGHQYGDLLLTQVGPRLRDELRESDTFGRLGGDEFAVILGGAGEAEAAMLAGKMLRALERPFQVGEQVLEVSASMGIALCPAHGEDVVTLLQHADSAMYVAKRLRNSFAFYTPDESPEPAANPPVLMAELRQAIENGQNGGLKLLYQPQLSLRTGELLGVEALVRWPHPTRGLVPPDQFVPMAERHGLIRALTQWVLGEALRQLHQWQDTGFPIAAAVNLSTRDLRDPRLCDGIIRLLEESGVDPSLLRIEITETMIVADPQQAMQVVRRLHDVGIRFSIDDFGSGYSSLSYLRDLPAQEIKIDKSFVRDILTDDSDAAIVRSVIELAHNLGRVTVAEGVESAAVWEHLRELGCDAAQGNYLAEPLTPADLERWLRNSAALPQCTLPSIEATQR